MALFNRKKDDASAPAASATEPKPLTNEAFDFDAISRDLDAQGGASSFDSLLSQPATPAGVATTKEADSAFDFPENDPLGLSSPPTNVPVRPTMAVPTTPDTVINAPLATPAMPSTGVAPLEPAPVLVPVKAKKSLPLIPLLGALGALAVLGGGAYLLKANKGDSEIETPSTLPQKPRPAQTAAPASQTASSPQTAPAAPDASLHSASPGIAPPTLPVTPIKGTSRVPIRVGQSPATPVRPAGSAAPAATSGLDPALASRLKALWQAGADAKHNKNYPGARDAWNQALKLAPKHPGFQDAINKLPR